MAKKKTAAQPRGIHTTYQPQHFRSKSDWLAYACWFRRNARIATGCLPEPPNTPLREKVFDHWEGMGYSCEKVCFESLPGFYCTGDLFRPAGKGRRKGKAPGILCPHGHWPDGRLHDRDPLGSVIARCIQLARMGATVFSYDMVGYNDSCQVPHHELKSDAHWALSLMALQTMNSVRALDFLLTLPDVDPRRIGITGTSGGGTQSFVMMAVDDRLVAAAPICMISYTMQGGCLCENTPLLRVDGTSVDLARLFAPRPMFIGSCTGDWTKNTPKAEYPAVREVYKLMGNARGVANLHIDEAHNYSQPMREAVYGFFNKALFGAKSAAAVREVPVARPPMRDRMVWWGRAAPKKMPFAELRKRWIKLSEEALRPCLKSAAAARKHLGLLLPHALGIAPWTLESAGGAKPRGTRISVEGDAMTVEPTGKVRDVADRFPHYTAYNRCFVGDRVLEVLSAIDSQPGRVKLVGMKSAGPWCLLAAALSKKVKGAEVSLAGFNPSSDASWRKHFDVPAIRRIGGLEAAFALIGGRPLELTAAHEAVRKLARKYAR